MRISVASVKSCCAISKGTLTEGCEEMAVQSPLCCTDVDAVTEVKLVSGLQTRLGAALSRHKWKPNRVKSSLLGSVLGSPPQISRMRRA